MNMSNHGNNRRLLSPEREELILSGLGDGVRTIAELAESLQVSEATVRRDPLEDGGSMVLTLARKLGRRRRRLGFRLLLQQSRRKRHAERLNLVLIAEHVAIRAPGLRSGPADAEAQVHRSGAVHPTAVQCQVERVFALRHVSQFTLVRREGEVSGFFPVKLRAGQNSAITTERNFPRRYAVVQRLRHVRHPRRNP